MEATMREQWLELMAAIGASDDSEHFFNEIIRRYSESHRAYHTLSHIEHCLRELRTVEQEVPNVLAIEYALWYHDLIYNTRSHENEEKSAERAVDVADELGLRRRFSNDVWRLIIATKHSFEPNADDEKFLVDIDLSILGQPQKAFEQYERQIRKEYSWVPADLYVQERSKILQGFLDRQSIFSTPEFQGKYELTARENLEGSLVRLATQPFN